MVDTLEEYYETPGDGLQRWQMQLGEEDEGFLRWLRVAISTSALLLLYIMRRIYFRYAQIF